MFSVVSTRLRVVSLVTDIKHDFQRKTFIDALESALVEQAESLTKSLTTKHAEAGAMTSPEASGADCEWCESRPATHWCHVMPGSHNQRLQVFQNTIQ